MYLELKWYNQYATNYVRFLRVIQILSGTIELVKWNAFWKVHNANDFKNSIKVIEKFAVSRQERSAQLLKGYLQYKTIISQSVSSEA